MTAETCTEPTQPFEIAVPAPVGAEEFSALMQSFAPFSQPLAVAVSGGPDSMALAYCVKRWRENGKTVALIVDHALRPESSEEAEATKKSLAAIGIEAEILRWEHAATVTRLHESARKARYRLLLDACRRRGIAELLFAHQRDDQAETILMRFAKGSGIDGLAGMAAQKRMQGVRILRPLLAVPRGRLVATCNAAHVPFAIDPGNEAQKFARGRLRRVMPMLAAEGFTIERLTDLGARAADAKEALDSAANALLRVATQSDETGAIRFDLEHLRSAPRAVAMRAIAACLHTIQPADYAPEHASLLRLTEALRAGGDMRSCTLHGCLIAKTGSQASFMREYAAITDEPPIKPGETILWDRRWRVHLSKHAHDTFTVRALGNPPHEEIDRLVPGLRKRCPQGRARASLPALWLNGALALIPALDGAADGNAEAGLIAAGPRLGNGD